MTLIIVFKTGRKPFESLKWLSIDYTLFSLSDHYILSREWRVIVEHGRHTYGAIISQVLIMRDPVGCVLSRRSTLLAVEKASAFGLGFFYI